jgi:hypothetical protein
VTRRTASWTRLPTATTNPQSKMLDISRSPKPVRQLYSRLGSANSDLANKLKKLSELSLQDKDVIDSQQKKLKQYKLEAEKAT